MTKTTTGVYTGSCACGGVAYQVENGFDELVACHCGQCRKMSGHYYAAARTLRTNFTLTRQETLRWYQSSDVAERGFCHKCGSVLFYRLLEGKNISVSAGSIDEPVGIQISKHIFVADKGDYYTIADNLPKIDKF